MILLIQTVLMLIGIGDDGGADDIDISADAEIGADLELDSDINNISDAADGLYGSQEVLGDADISGMDGLRIFTVRGIIAFLVVFGWVGMALEAAHAPLWVSLLMATVSGIIIMIVLAAMMRAVLKLRDNGNTDNRNAIGVAGKVYLSIPPERSGEGKVNIMLQGAYVERDAVTDEEEPIPTGCEVVVVALSGQTTLVVKRK